MHFILVFTERPERAGGGVERRMKLKKNLLLSCQMSLKFASSSQQSRPKANEHCSLFIMEEVSASPMWTIGFPTYRDPSPSQEGLRSLSLYFSLFLSLPSALHNEGRGKWIHKCLCHCRMCTRCAKTCVKLYRSLYRSVFPSFKTNFSDASPRAPNNRHSSPKGGKNAHGETILGEKKQ